MLSECVHVTAAASRVEVSVAGAAFAPHLTHAVAAQTALERNFDLFKAKFPDYL
jgi:phosphoribosylcarboxyaminoimidazole (NCAIR) mutase